jgi:prevent-host-death family protein
MKGGKKVSPLKFITISELKQNAKKILAEVKRTGQQVTVTVNGKPVVVLSPAREEAFSYQDEPKKKSK